jgi:hypothetical protein
VGDDDPRDTADAVIALGRLALRFGRVDRITYHDDAVTPNPTPTTPSCSA